MDSKPGPLEVRTGAAGQDNGGEEVRASDVYLVLKNCCSQVMSGEKQKIYIIFYKDVATNILFLTAKDLFFY